MLLKYVLVSPLLIYFFLSRELQHPSLWKTLSREHATLKLTAGMCFEQCEVKEGALTNDHIQGRCTETSWAAAEEDHMGDQILSTYLPSRPGDDDKKVFRNASDA